MKKIIALHIIFLWVVTPLFAQVPDSVSTDTTGAEIVPAGTLNPLSLPSDTTKQEVEDEPEPTVIIPWEEKKPIGAQTITNDSLMRWQIWPNWGDYQAYRRDVISFRQGTSGRIDAYHINGYEPHEQ